MTAVSDYATKQKAYNAAIGASIDGIVSDIQHLNETIKTLQDSAGTVTPEDQATIDELQAQGQALADKATALDAQNPPPVTGVDPSIASNNKETMTMTKENQTQAERDAANNPNQTQAQKDQAERDRVAGRSPQPNQSNPDNRSRNPDGSFRNP